MCVICGAPADFATMCRPCLEKWAEIKTRAWIIRSKQQLERYKSKQSREAA